MSRYINVLEVIDSPSALTQEEGNMVYEEIVSALDHREKITVDFEGIESMISPFLNNSIGQLYGRYNSDEIKEYLDLKDFPQNKIGTLNVVISNAKKFYNNPKRYEDIVKEVTNN